LYHTPDSHSFGQTNAEIRFDTEESAQAAGYTEAEDIGQRSEPTVTCRREPMLLWGSDSLTGKRQS